MDLKFVHLLVSRDGTVTPVKNPIGLGCRTYLTTNGEYHLLDRTTAGEEGGSIALMYDDDLAL